MGVANRLVLTMGLVDATVPWVWTRYASAGRALPAAAAQMRAQRPAVPVAGTPTPITAPVPGFEPRRMRFDTVRGQFVSTLPEGQRAVLNDQHPLAVGQRQGSAGHSGSVQGRTGSPGAALGE